MTRTKLILPLILILLSCAAGIGNETEKSVVIPSVTVTNEEGIVLGSGTVFKNKGKTYVLTCGHLFSKMRTTQKVKVDQPDGTTKEIEKVTFKNPRALRVKFVEGKEVGGSHSVCKIIAYSPPEEEGGCDLAVLEVFDSEFSKEAAQFSKDNKTVKPNLDIIHVGALYGMSGCVVRGHISRLDVEYKGQSFNIANLGGRPGSSGGGVFAIENGRYVYVGMTVRGDSGGLMMLKRPETIREWLKSVKLEHIIQ